MSFVENSAQQLCIYDTGYGLSEREKRFLSTSWAKYFADCIFPAIDERPYEVLYSTKASRPNTPVNVIIGALLLKELNGLTDEGIFHALLFDVRYRTALHTTSFEEQPMSDRTLSRFRAKCLSYQAETGIDLLHGTICSLAEKIAEMTGADRSLLRMDSLMIESNIRRYSRLELIYTCAADAVRKAAKTNELPEDLKHYLEPGDHNRTFYHRNADEENILREAAEAEKYLHEIGEQPETLRRVLSEQTETVEEEIQLRPKEELHSRILQSPHDTDATFRRKGHGDHIGYVANVVECRNDKSSVILDHQYEPNVYSDSRFLKDGIAKAQAAKEEITLVADGGYAGKENTETARKKNIRLITTNLTGRPNRAYKEYRSTEEFRKYARFRNGVETIPSILRRKYRIDHMPVRGRLATAFFFGCKIGAINITKFCIAMQGLGKCAIKPKE